MQFQFARRHFYKVLFVSVTALFFSSAGLSAWAATAEDLNTDAAQALNLKKAVHSAQ